MLGLAHMCFQEGNHNKLLNIRACKYSMCTRSFDLWTSFRDWIMEDSNKLSEALH